MSEKIEMISRRGTFSLLGLVAALGVALPAEMLTASDAEAQAPSTAPAPSGGTSGTERRQDRTGRTERRQKRRTSRTERRTKRRSTRTERRSKRRGGGETKQQ
jgi:hypothetical protein